MVNRALEWALPTRIDVAEKSFLRRATQRQDVISRRQDLPIGSNPITRRPLNSLSHNHP